MQVFKEEITYSFICKECGSLLVGKPNDFQIIGKNLLKYHCPVCGKWKQIKYRNLAKKTIYVKD